MGKLFSASEASDIVYRYVEQENLVKPTYKSCVILDAVLCDALYKGAVKKGFAYPTEIHKKDLGVTFIGRMQPHHIVARGNDSVVRKGALKPIQIMTERRQGNKEVTRLSGLEAFLVDPESLASELQKKFACSTTVAELPGKKGFKVLVQGGVIASGKTSYRTTESRRSTWKFLIRPRSNARRGRGTHHGDQEVMWIDARSDSSHAKAVMFKLVRDIFGVTSYI